MGRLAESDSTAVLPVAIGTGIWSVLLVVLVLGRTALADRGLTWWIGVAVVGVVSGALGLVFLTWRQGRRARQE